MANKLLPIVIKKSVPQRLMPLRKQVQAQPFAKQWPRILAYMVAHPEKSTKELWEHWSSRVDDIFSRKEFATALKVNEMTPAVVRGETSQKSQVKNAIASFQTVKKDHADRFMRRISKKLNEVHNVVDKTKVTKKNVGGVLDLVSRLHKEGRLAYGIDEQHTVDKQTTNIAVLIGYEPTLKAKSVASQIVEATSL